MKRSIYFGCKTFFIFSILAITSCESGEKTAEDSIDIAEEIDASKEISESNNASTTLPEGYISIEDENYDMSYPSQWNLQKYSGEVSFALETDLYSKDETMNDNVSLMPFTESEDRLKIHDEVFMKLTMDEMQSKIPGMEFISFGLETIADQEFYKLVYTFEQGGFSNMIQQRYFVGDDMDFSLTYISRKDSYEVNKTKVEKSLNTFRIK